MEEMEVLEEAVLMEKAGLMEETEVPHTTITRVEKVRVQQQRNLASQMANYTRMVVTENGLPLKVHTEELQTPEMVVI